MQLTTYLLVALAASTTALPGTVPEPATANIADYEPTPEDAAIFNQTLPELEKRGHYGWITSFANTDPQCKGGYAGARPKVKGKKCVKFHPVQHRVKIDWGTWPLAFDNLDIFFDGDCKFKINSIKKGKHDQSCVKVKGFWGSVRYNDVQVGE